MTDINRLVSLNVQLEGLLKVLLERDSMPARSALAERYREYSQLMEAFLSGDGPAPSKVVEAAGALAADAHHVEVKDQEAQEAEAVDETDAAAAAIARETHRTSEAAEREKVLNDVAAASRPAPQVRANTVTKAFTLNDKFRFIRDIFGGNERDFNDTIALVADMESYSEAADYIYNDMMLDPENADVADFMEILSRNMPA